jgi:hypothetical protein
VDANVSEVYAVPTVPAVSGLAVEIERAAVARLIVTLRGFEAVPRVPPPVSVALTVTLNVPAAVGVPPIAPVEAFRFNPVGRLLPEEATQLQLYGVVPPEAAN